MAATITTPDRYQATATAAARPQTTVNPAFTAPQPKPRKRIKPTEDWGKFMGRLCRAFVRRAAAEDPWVVADAMNTLDDLQRAVDQMVLSLIKRGYSYQLIADELTMRGRPMTKQNVSQRWGKIWREMSGEQRDAIPA